MNDPVGVEMLTKGLSAFHVAPGQSAAVLPNNYLQDYLDAFLEEAYEHEYEECRHRSPRLEGGDPHMQICRAVYNELLTFAVHNKNLLRAIKKFSIDHPKYVMGRLNFMGLLRVNSSNYDAEESARVGGYHPERVEPLALESPPGYKQLDHVAAAAERDAINQAIQGGQNLADGPEMVQLRDDYLDPFQALKRSHDARPNPFGRQFVVDQGVVPTIDNKCPVHGLGDLTKSQNLANIYVQCSCPED